MIRDVILPQLAMGMSEGSIVEWLVAEGARVERDQTIVLIETEKVITDLPSPYAGYLHLLAKKGDTHPTETVIARIADSEDEYRSLVGAVGEQSSRVDAGDCGDGLVNLASGSSAQEDASGAVRDLNMPASPVGEARKLRASGLARAIARKSGVDLSWVPGTGPGGRIVRRDVVAAIERAKPAAQAPQTRLAPSAQGMRERMRIPVAGMRAAIAQKMLAATTTAAQTYAFFEIDITKLLAARNTILGYEDELATRVSLISFYVRSVALACQHVPICNSTLANGEISAWENVNVGVAVALPGGSEHESGLIVPVVRDVQDKGLLQIDREVKDLVRRARASGLSPAETANGTITVSSTDGFLPGGWMVSTPLLNLPQVMNFQPGTPVEKPVVVDGRIEIRTLLPCGVTFDHRAMDGEPLGRFVRKIRDLLSNPELMLL
ncbi:dihydrolipoamide acetyltransferase family protein [Thauera sp. SDU_THAU2]|uniref:dihydrolipoamide acetyltransferase family protein n=1 Tax=Thauera sp. SDU_THAU2 TaxID=3136633 RepID=UPI00311D4D38